MAIFELNIFGFTLAPSYYGLMYALAFVFGYLIIKRRDNLNPSILYPKCIPNSFPKKGKEAAKSGLLLDDLVLYIFLGVIVGGRIGYTMFYNFNYYIHNLVDILKVWEGGMSFHGGVIGVILAMVLFAKKYKINFYNLADEVCAILPIGLGLGRIGNYLNGELLGYSGYIGILAVQKNGVSYFPSPLLEFFLEGIVLYIILLYFYKHKKFNGQIAVLFLIFYGIFRLFVEIFFRTPDAHIGYIMGYFTVGEILTLPMIIGGMWFYWRLSKK